MTLSDLESQGGLNFLADLHNYAPMVWPKMTKFGTVTQAGEQHISRVSYTSGPKAAGPQRPQNFLDPLLTLKWFDLERSNLAR